MVVRKNEIFNTVRGRGLQTAYFLDEGLFEEVQGVTTKGADIIMVNVAEDEGKMIVAGDMVRPVADKDYTVEKVGTTNPNQYMGTVVADPVGVPPTAEGMPLREATVEHMVAGSTYHLKLKDTAGAVTANVSYIVFDGEGFVPSATKVDGVVLIAKESAPANSGKYIDAYCEDIAYVAPS